MTIHTLKMTIRPGYELGPQWTLHCSDNGGAHCNEGDVANDCEYVAAARADHGPDEEDIGDLEYLDLDCEGRWWEGDHYHGRVGSGCFLIPWFDADQESWELAVEHTISLPVRVTWRGEDEPLRVTFVTEKKDK